VGRGRGGAEGESTSVVGVARVATAATVAQEEEVARRPLQVQTPRPCPCGPPMVVEADVELSVMNRRYSTSVRTYAAPRRPDTTRSVSQDCLGGASGRR